MRVIHVIPSIDEEASGPSYSAVRLCESLIDTGLDVEMAALDSGRGSVRQPFLRTFPSGAGPKRLGSSPAMSRWLVEQLSSGAVDIVHNHSLWMMPNVYAGYAARHRSSCLVVSPRGTLSPRALLVSALRKRVFWQLLQRRAVRGARCFHATSEQEYLDIRRRGFRQPVCVVPNGIDIPSTVVRGSADRRTLLFLGRIDPIKGLDSLLRAWQAVEQRFPDWELVIAGPDSRGHLGELRALATALRLSRVQFKGPVFGASKFIEYRAASLSVLPSHSENFGMTVAESLAAGTPAIVTKGAPWSGLPAAGAGWWIENGVESLAACFEESLAASPARLQHMGEMGREWMRREFSWDRIGRELADVYRWLHHGGAVPACVRAD